jgi:organic hydroperoxide reductase OsmC/OhrA
MTSRTHRYETRVAWSGNLGTGTSGYKAYARTHEIGAPGRPAIPASSDPTFRGDKDRWNPEQLLVASLSSCHMLWYLHLCADAGIVVMSYEDEAEGEMLEGADGGGRFTSVVLRPRVGLASGSNVRKAQELHHEAHAKCFIASSVSFPVRCGPTIA